MPPSPTPSPPLSVPIPRIGERIRVYGGTSGSQARYAYQQKHKWIVHYDDGDIRTHNLTEMTWNYDVRVILPIAFEVVTRFDMPDHSQKWLHGRIRHSAVEAKKVTYTVEYTGADNKVFDAEIDQDFEKGTSRPVFKTVTYPKFRVGDAVQTLFVDDTGAHAWWTGHIKFARPLDQILATRDRKHYLVTYSDGDTWMHSQDLMPQSISLV